jgi:integrase
MARPRKSRVRTRTLKDGSITFWAMPTVAVGDRRNIILGSSRDGMDENAAEETLKRLEAQVVLGQWDDPRPLEGVGGDTLFHEFASECCADKRLELSDNGADYIEWALRLHLLPFFAPHRLNEIDVELIARYMKDKLRQRDALAKRIAAGERIVDSRGQSIKPLSNSSINKTLEVLKSLLNIAFERGWIPRNPAAAKSLRLVSRGRRQTWLMPDHVIDLIDAAERIDRRNKPETRERATRVQALRAKGKTVAAAARAVGVCESTAIYLSGVNLAERERSIRRAIVATLVLSGLRVSELCALCWRDIDFVNRKICAPGTKTDAAQREIKIVDFLLAELERWRADAPSTNPDDLVFPSTTGKRRTKGNLIKDVLSPAVREANRIRALQDLPHIGGQITPHTMRRTFVGLMLSHGVSIPSVQYQAGHEDARTTLQIYAQVGRMDFEPTRKQLTRLCAYTTAGAKTPRAASPPVRPRRGPRRAQAAPDPAGGESRRAARGDARPARQPRDPSRASSGAATVTFSTTGLYPSVWGSPSAVRDPSTSGPVSA